MTDGLIPLPAKLEAKYGRKHIRVVNESDIRIILEKHNFDKICEAVAIHKKRRFRKDSTLILHNNGKTVTADVQRF